MVKLPITVVIPCYQQERWLNSAVESVFKQTDDVIIAHEGKFHSTLDSIPHPRRILGPGYNHLWFEGMRAGACYCRNLGISLAINDLILCLDADDRLLPDGLERLYAAYNPGTWVYGGWQEIDENEVILGDYEAPPAGMINRKNLCYSTFLFHKDDWRKVGGFDPDFEIGCEDYAFQVALTAAGVQPFRIEGQVYQRMIHENGRTARAKALFPVLQGLIKDKYPSVFAG